MHITTIGVWLREKGGGGHGLSLGGAGTWKGWSGNRMMYTLTWTCSW